MNDRFKFRVWQTELQVPKMKYNSGIGFINNQLDDTDCVIMQCTGLKDKNGKLIYEGDIVKFRHLDNHFYTGQIEFDNEICIMKLVHFGKSAYHKPNEWEYIDRFRLEIIGNIYENAELIEANDNE